MISEYDENRILRFSIDNRESGCVLMDNYDSVNDIWFSDFKLNFTENVIDTTYIAKDLDIISNPNVLHESYDKCRKGVYWKESVQRYGMNELKNIISAHNNIENDTYKPKKVNEFELNERGHKRDIKSHHISDRVIQKSLNDNILIPRLSNLLIYDNGASQEGKGISFARSRFEVHLRNAYKEFGNDGYILLMDFSKFFDNINHEILLNQFRPYLSVPEFHFVENCFKEFEIDVSYLTDEEFETCLDTLFNSLEYAKIDKSKLTKQKFMRKSVGIGSQTSQISGIFYPHEIDNFCKYVMGIKYYGRYMDDTYIIGRKEELDYLYPIIESKCNELGIFINKKKTYIKNIRYQIPYLKINYILRDSGSLIRKVNSANIRRELRRINKFFRLYSDGKITLEEAYNNYKSWRGTYSKYDSGYDILKLDQYFIRKFNIDKNTKFNSGGTLK